MDIITCAEFIAHGLIVIAPVKGPTKSACILGLISGANEGGLIEMGANFNFLLD